MNTNTTNDEPHEPPATQSPLPYHDIADNCDQRIAPLNALHKFETSETYHITAAQPDCNKLD